MAERSRIYVIEEHSFDRLKVSDEMKSALPVPKLNSRNVIAYILSYYGRKLEVYKLTLGLSKSSRAFIITQNGLQGFLKPSWLIEIEKSFVFREKMLGFLLPEERILLPDALSKLTSKADKEAYLR